MLYKSIIEKPEGTFRMLKESSQTTPNEKLYLFILLASVCTSEMRAQTMTLGQGNNEGVIVTTSSNSQNTDGSNTTDSQGFLPNLNSASRFLSQATFGPNIEDIESLITQGIENWIDAQFNTPKAFNLVDSLDGYYDIRKNNGEDGLNQQHWDFTWWSYTMGSDDDLRQRVALALSEFFVISSINA